MPAIFANFLNVLLMGKRTRHVRDIIMDGLALDTFHQNIQRHLTVLPPHGDLLACLCVLTL
jgi:hypothetical protein